MGEIDDSEAIKLHELICEDIANTKYTDVNTLLHAFDIMLKFSLIGLGKQSVEDIINLVKEYLTTIKASKELSIDDEPESTLKFLSFGSPYFSTIYRYICEYAVELRNEKINGILQEICQLLPANPDEFIKRFPCDHIYYPVSLVSLDAKDFAQKIAGVSGPKLRYIMDKIYYNIRSINEKQSDDIIWTNNFIDALTENLPYMPPVARHIANITLQQFKESVFEKWPTPDDY